MKKAALLAFLLCCLPNFLRAQWAESFTDGDFTANPAWTGDLMYFTVNASKQLQSNGPNATSAIYLATANTQCNNTEWSFYLGMNFSPSNGNHARVYLMSDQADLKKPLNGYYIRVGEDGSSDAVDLYRQQGNTHTRIIRGVAGRVSASPKVRIRVIRDAKGNWQVYSENTGGTNFSIEGIVSDNTFTTTGYFGVFCTHSATRRQGFVFDDFLIADPPISLSGAEAISQTQVRVQFSTLVDEASATNTANYQIDKGVEISAVLISQNDLSSVILTLANALITNQYTLIVKDIRDKRGNTIDAASTVTFHYTIPIRFRELVINELMADESPRVDLPLAEFIELLNTTDRTINLDGCALADPGTKVMLPAYELPPGGYVILCKNTFATEFHAYGPVLGLSNWPALNNSGDEVTLTNPSGILIDKIHYTSAWYDDKVKSEGGWTLEQINPHTLCNNAANWRASTDISGGTPGRQNSGYSTQADQNSPQLLDIICLSPTKIRLDFSETMDSVRLRDGHYQLSSGLHVQSIQPLYPDYISVEISLNEGIEAGKVYQVHVNGLTDCAGNALPASQIRFGVGLEPQYHQLLITEIMADETPPVGLPEFEFLELYNPTEQIISLDKVTLTDATATAKLAKQILFPGEYLILCTSSALPLWRSYGRAMSVSGLSLNNSGEPLTLRNTQGSLIFSVEYSPEWYQNAAKAAGGWSLEMIDVHNPCGGSGNWSASEDPNGGTPGRKNSVAADKPDLTSPQVVKVEVIDEYQVIVGFNEQVDSLSTVNPALFDLAPAIPIQGVVMYGYMQVKLTLEKPISPKVQYMLSIKAIRDCSGNISGVLSASFVLPEQGDSLDLVINEVLFNPRKDGVDFVEIYNRSDKYVSLKGWQLANIDKGEAANQKLITDQHQVLPPRHYLVFTNDGRKVKSHYPKAHDAHFLPVKSMPTYPDKEGSVVLMNNHNTIVDRFDYSDKMHFSLIDDVEGVSLERISANAPTQLSDNWHSAASSEGYATPGYQNSQQVSVAESASPFSVNPRVFTPDEDGWNDFTTIQYTIAGNGTMATVTVYDAQGRAIKQLARNELLATGGFLQWDGTNDKGEKVRVGRYIIHCAHFNLNGKQQVFKETVVVGAKF